MKNLLIVFLLYLITNNVFALSIVYDGFKCEDESSTSAVSAQSRFTVAQDLGNGNYKLWLSGAFLDYEEKFCLKSLDTIFTEQEILQFHKAPIEAIASFNGDVLVVSYGTIARNPDSALDDPFLFADISFPRAYTLIFDYEPSRRVFKLRSVTLFANVFTTSISPDEKKSLSAFWVESPALTDEIEFFLED
ncbi:MAG: hypothetical protein KF888_05850 [Nitrosomonas sp.]|nr:hypothetical protein [Nitrosomonas sp.]